VCRGCHLRWHAKLTPNSGQREIWTQRGLVWSSEEYGWRAEYRAGTIGWVVSPSVELREPCPFRTTIRRYFVEDAAGDPVGDADGYASATSACRVVEQELLG
jgi:hypothetical protein